MGSSDSGEALTSERLAVIRANVSEMWKSHITRAGMAGALEQAEADCGALLCEVYEMREQHEQLAGFYDMAMHALKQTETLNERLRAREAALVAEREQAMAIVRAVAGYDEPPLWTEDDEREWFADLNNHWPCIIKTEGLTGRQYHEGPCVIEQARALLASAEQEGGGDGA